MQFRYRRYSPDERIRKQMLYRFCVHICAPCTAILCVQGLSVSPEQWRKT
nr:MAG TPA: hypothetical protein [Caudoviricetes sp.]